MVPVHGGAGGATRVVSGRPGRILGNTPAYAAPEERQFQLRLEEDERRKPIKAKKRFDDDRRKHHREIDAEILKEYVKRQLTKLRGIVRTQEAESFN